MGCFEYLLRVYPFPSHLYAAVFNKGNEEEALIEKTGAGLDPEVCLAMEGHHFPELCSFSCIPHCYINIISNFCFIFLVALPTGHTDVHEGLPQQSFTTSSCYLSHYDRLWKGTFDLTV